MSSMWSPRLLVLTFAGALVQVGGLRAQESGDQDSAAISAALETYIAAFNDNDAAAVASHWAEDAVHVDRESGLRLEGREALQSDFEALFEEQPGLRLDGEIDSVRFVRDDVALVEGTATVFGEDLDPIASRFSGTYVREEQGWLLHTVHESSLPVPETTIDALQPLAWLVGNWVDDSGDVRVDTTVRWSPGEAFLIRTFRVQQDDGSVREGTQYIVWDPRRQRIRSWTFNSDGSFGDGVWMQRGAEWLIRSSQTLPDGLTASGVYVVTQIDSDSMTIQLTAHEIEGELQPLAEPVRIVRTAGGPDGAEPGPDE